MEIIVRLHRFVRDKLHDRRIAFLPHPVAWTEVPETLESLRKQRGRWYRGLRESLRYHRAMLGAGSSAGSAGSRCRRSGSSSISARWSRSPDTLSSCSSSSWSRCSDCRFINYDYLWAFLLASLGYGILVNVFAVLVGAWRFRARPGRPAAAPPAAVQPAGGKCFILLVYAVLENFGFRQLTLYWRLRGLWDAWRGQDRMGEVRAGRVPRGAAPAHG